MPNANISTLQISQELNRLSGAFFDLENALVQITASKPRSMAWGELAVVHPNYQEWEDSKRESVQVLSTAYAQAIENYNNYSQRTWNDARISLMDSFLGSMIPDEIINLKPFP